MIPKFTIEVTCSTFISINWNCRNLFCKTWQVAQIHLLFSIHKIQISIDTHVHTSPIWLRHQWCIRCRGYASQYRGCSVTTMFITCIWSIHSIRTSTTDKIPPTQFTTTTQYNTNQPHTMPSPSCWPILGFPWQSQWRQRRTHMAVIPPYRMYRPGSTLCRWPVVGGWRPTKQINHALCLRAKIHFRKAN